MKFIRKPLVVEAVQFFGGVDVPEADIYTRWDDSLEGVIFTSIDRLYFRESDWIVTHSDGSKSIFRDEVFRREFAPVLSESFDYENDCE